MKKRVLALLLSAVLCMGLIGTASADVVLGEDEGGGVKIEEDLPVFENSDDPEPEIPPVQPEVPDPSIPNPVIPWAPPSGTGSTDTKPSQPAKDPVEEPGEDPEPDEPTEPTEPSTPAMPFVDVSAGDWFYGAVQYVFENGIMTGDGSAATFNPRGNMTRAMVWTVLGRLSGADVSSTGAAWYAKAQSWAVSTGISDGTNPNGSITREELVTMLWRYAGSPTASADLSVFSDSASVSSWANSAMQWAVSTGILTGDNGRLNPGSSATRAEVAAILMRYCEIIAG